MAGAFSVPQAMKPPVGRRPVPANCLVDELSVDPAYQRSIDNQQARKLIRSIALNWDWSLCQPLIVARRQDETLWVVDGQHRLAAAIERGDIRDLPCVIIHYGDLASEAKGFVALNTARRALTPYAIFNAAVASGDESAVTLAALMSELGFSATGGADVKQLKPGQLQCVNMMRSHQARHGDVSLRRVLSILAAAFPEQVMRYGALLFSAIASTVTPPQQIDDGLLIGVLGGASQDEWAQAIIDDQAASGRSRSMAAIEVLRTAYAEANDE